MNRHFLSGLKSSLGRQRTRVEAACRLPLLCLAAILACASIGHAQGPAPVFCERWQDAYSGSDAGGQHVLALWQFVQGRELEDSSGRGHTLTLEGAVINPHGKFGLCLESFPGHPVEDKRHAAVAASHPRLSPRSAFTLELWINPKPALTNGAEVFLLDKKYVAHTDYQLTLGGPDASGQRRLVARLGFGADSETYTSDPATYAPGEWRHVAFTYDSKGAARFFLDGAALGGGRRPGRGSIMPGQHPLSIGDRIGSYYHGFPGSIAQVRLSEGALKGGRTERGQPIDGFTFHAGHPPDSVGPMGD